MNREEFSQAILKCFSEIYGEIYIGSLFITKKPNKAIDVGIGLNHREAPIHLIAELSEEEYIEWFKKEIRKMKLNERVFGYVSRVSEIHPLPCRRKN